MSQHVVKCRKMSQIVVRCRRLWDSSPSCCPLLNFTEVGKSWTQSGKSQKGQNRTNGDGRAQDWEPPDLRRPCQPALQPIALKVLHSPFFTHPKKRSFLFFFLWGDPVQNRPRNPAPGRSLFSTRKSRSEVPERQDFGEENWLGKGGVDRAKKRKKGCAKKGGSKSSSTSCQAGERELDGWDPGGRSWKP